MDYLLFARELFVKNFCVSIKAIQFKKLIIKETIFFYLLRLIPFYFIKKLSYIRCVYLLDNIYFSNYSK